MKIKLLGVGKCGSRLCYDFFAQIRNLPTSYEIRAALNQAGWKRVAKLVIDKTGYPHLRHEVRKQWEALVGADLLRDQAFYAIVDSDLDNNEVAGQFELLAANGEALVFPGKCYSLNGVDGGCQFHIISEQIAHQWKPVPEELVSPEGGEIFAFAFSTGGGTGGGAAAQLAAASRDRQGQRSPDHIVHRMGIAVLPSSDQAYFIEENPRSSDGRIELPPPPMDLVERYNTGRFFVSLLGGRTSGIRSSTKAFNGTWLISNDLLRVIIRETATTSAEIGSAKILDKQGLSLVNSYIGLALCTLCNASSRATQSDSDLDARELNNHLNTLYISAFGHAKRDMVASGEGLVLQLQTLLQRAICGNRIVEGQLQGVSVPLTEIEVKSLQSMLMAPAATLNEFKRGLAGKAFQNVPREFLTARRVVMLLGQPQGASSNLEFEEAAKVALSSVFANSELVWFSFRHAGDLDYLLLFIVDPFVPVVANSMFDYISKTWMRTDAPKALMPSYVRGQADRSLLNGHLLVEDELLHLPDSPIGEATRESIGTTVTIPFGPEIVVAALDGLRAEMNWKKDDPPRM